jgi:hypothetical protein
MIETPELHAYIVTLSFEGGPLHTNTVLAQNQVIATCLTTTGLMQRTPVTTPLIGCFCVELGADYLRHLLRAVEGKLPAGGTADVVSLVPKPAEMAIEAWRKEVQEPIRPQGVEVYNAMLGQQGTPIPPGAA